MCCQPFAPKPVEGSMGALNFSPAPQGMRGRPVSCGSSFCLQLLTGFMRGGCSSNRQRRGVSAEGFNLRRRLPLVVPQALDCLLLVPSDLASAEADELPIPVLLERTVGVPPHPKKCLWTELSRLGDFSGCGRSFHFDGTHPQVRGVPSQFSWCRSSAWSLAMKLAFLSRRP